MGIRGLYSHIDRNGVFTRVPELPQGAVLIDFHAWVLWLGEHSSPGHPGTAEQVLGYDTPKLCDAALFFLRLLEVNGLTPELVVDGSQGSGSVQDVERKIPIWRKRRQASQNNYRALSRILDHPPSKFAVDKKRSIYIGDTVMEYQIAVRKHLQCHGYYADSCEGEGDRTIDWIFEACDGQDDLPGVKLLLTNDTDLVLMPNCKVLFLQNLESCSRFWSIFCHEIEAFMHSPNREPVRISERSSHHFDAVQVARSLDLKRNDFPGLAALCGGDYFIDFNCPHLAKVVPGARALRAIQPVEFENLMLRFPQVSSQEFLDVFKYTCLFYRVIEDKETAEERVRVTDAYIRRRKAVYGLRAMIRGQRSPWREYVGELGLNHLKSLSVPSVKDWFQELTKVGGSSTLVAVRGDNHINLQRIGFEFDKQHPFGLSAAYSLEWRKRMYKIALSQLKDPMVQEWWNVEGQLREIQVEENLSVDPRQFVHMNDEQRVQLCMRALYGMDLSGRDPVHIMGPAEALISQFLGFVGHRHPVAVSLLVGAVLLATLDGQLELDQLHETCIDRHLSGRLDVTSNKGSTSLSGASELVFRDLNLFRLPDELERASWFKGLSTLRGKFRKTMQGHLTNDYRNAMNASEQLSSELLAAVQRIHFSFSQLISFYTIFLLTLNVRVMCETLIDFHLTWWVHGSQENTYSNALDTDIRNLRAILPQQQWFQSLGEKLQSQGRELLS